MTANPGVPRRSTTGRAVVAAATLGSGMAMLDGSVVNVALRTIGQDLDASLEQLQWVTNGYLLSLAGLIMLGGSLGDRFGRRRVFIIGVVVFAIASAACGLAPSAGALIAARVVQGIGGALLTPGSLAMIQGAIAPADRPAAIGAWSGLGSIAMAIGPFVGGVLVEYASWPWVFLINLPLAAITVIVARRWVPETRDPAEHGRFDAAGAVLVSVALAGITYALIDSGSGIAAPAAVIGVAAGIAFVVVEHRRAAPMLPLGLFRDRIFSASNAMTLLVYGALGALTFFLTLQLQTVSGYGALAAGLASLPITICMILLAGPGGSLGARIGARLPMTFGPLLLAAGCVLLLRVGPQVHYLTDVLPGVVLIGLGLSLMVATLTSTVLAAAPDSLAGIASGVNNAVARAGSLLAVAALPAAVGLAGAQYADPVAFDHGYRAAMLICAGLLVAGGVISWLLIRNPEPARA